MQLPLSSRWCLRLQTTLKGGTEQSTPCVIMNSAVAPHAGRVVNIGTLGSRPRVEAAVRAVQEACLADMFRVSMDTAAYAPLAGARPAPPAP